MKNTDRTPEQLIERKNFLKEFIIKTLTENPDRMIDSLIQSYFSAVNDDLLPHEKQNDDMQLFYQILKDAKEIKSLEE